MKRVMLHSFLLLFVSARFTSPLWAQASFVYTNNNTRPVNTVSAFSVGPNSTLTEIPGSPFPTGGTGLGEGFFAQDRITICAVGSFLYVANRNTGGSGLASVSGFSIDSLTGSLTPVPGSPFLTGGFAVDVGIALAATPDNQFLIATSIDSLTVFKIAADGSLAQVPSSPFFPFPRRFVTNGIKVSANGRFLAVALEFAGGVPHGAVAMFNIDSTTGELTAVPGSPFPVRDPGGPAGRATAVDINCASQTVFVSDGSVIDVMSIDPGGVLSPIQGSPFNPGGDLVSISPLLSADDKLLFVTNRGIQIIIVFQVGLAGTLTLVPGSPFFERAPFGIPTTMATNQAGTLLYVASASGSVASFTIDRSGVLKEVPGSPFATAPGSRLVSVAAFPPKSCVLEVAIDIKPRSINPNSKGKIPVAILSSSTFDAPERVDTASLTFGRTGDEASLAFCNPGSEDVNDDGLPDLVCHFHTQQTGFQPGDMEGILKGKTADGIPIRGKDSVRIVSRN